jgi:hypothetical protein
MDRGKAMMPKFWKYLITSCHGSASRIVAEAEREWAEKELESNTCLLSYTAKPQFESPVFLGPAEQVLRQLQRTRLDQKRMEMNHMHDPLSPSATNLGLRIEKRTARWLTCESLIQTTTARSHGWYFVPMYSAKPEFPRR